MDYTGYAQSGNGSTGSAIFNLLLWGALLLANWFLFEKAGQPGWKSIIPLYNVWTMFKIVYDAGWKMFLLFVPVLNFVVAIAFCIRFAQVYGKHWIWGVGMIFISPVITLMLAFGSARYRGPVYSFL